jgi:hypothetical protein
LDTTLNFDLGNEIRLIVENPSGEIDIEGVADFLVERMRQFKPRRLERKSAIPSTPSSGLFRKEFQRDGTILGTLELACKNPAGQSARVWTQTVVDAFVDAETVETLVRNPHTWRARAEKEGGWLLEICRDLDKHRGEFRAFEAMLRQSAERRASELIHR